ncbi:MAG: S8 family serine peptidase [Opitutales bacterium]|nr:S8 family serine peptidase [Opitutales bacterium]
MQMTPVSVRRKRRWVWAWTVVLAVAGGFWLVPDSGERAEPEPPAVRPAESVEQGPADRDAGLEKGRGSGGFSGAKSSLAAEGAALPEINRRDLPLVRDGKRLSGAALARWPGARVLTVRETAMLADGRFRRVGILQPADLPYRIRVEEFARRGNDGGDTVEHRVEMVADRILVRPSGDGPAEAFLDAALADLPAQPGDALTRSGWRRVVVDSDDPDAVPMLVAALGAGAVYAEPDYIVRSFAEPNDLRFLDGSLWGLRNTGQNNGVPGADISAEAGWATRHDAGEVIVGVIDSGLRLTHEDIVANLWTNPGETADGTDTSGSGYIDDIHGINAIDLSGNPVDESGHGTHVAGTIGAVGNNGVGMTGVAWNVRIMALRFLGAGGSGAVSDAILCIEYGVENRAHILNNSWGGPVYSAALYDAVKAARDAGVIFVAAVGNSASNTDLAPVFPASLPFENVVGVASTDRRDERSRFSSYGEGSVDLAAPGTDILSLGNDSDSHYRSTSGTSMAAPHVSGALALLRAEFPGDSWAQLINRLYGGVDRIAALDGGVVGTGGRLNLAGAFAADHRPANDSFAGARQIQGDVVLLRASNRGATSRPGEPVFGGEAQPKTVWFRYSPAASGQASVRLPSSRSIFLPMQAERVTIPYDNVLAVTAVFTGDGPDALEQVGSSTGGETLNFVVSSGTDYHIAVAGIDGAEGLLMLEVTGPPRNGELASALPLTLGRSVAGTNRNALAEEGETDHAGRPATASVWYKWTASVGGRVAFSTRGSDFNTVAAVYSGPAEEATFADLVPVAANINEPGSTFSRVGFQAVSGTTYYFAVDGFGGAEGAVGAKVGIPPPNDDFENSIVIEGTDIERRVTTLFASREEGEPRHLPGRGIGETVWYTWTAPENGRAHLTASATFAPAVIAVYTGSRVDALSLVTSDGASDRQTMAIFDAVQGTTYRIAVDAWNWSLIDSPFSLRMIPVPPNENFADAIALQGTRATVTGTNAGAGREPGEPSANYNGSGSVWYHWTAPVSGEVGIYGERLDKPRLRNIVLNIFEGDNVDTLTHVREDFGNGIGRDAYARWLAFAGRTYRIQVTSLNESFLFGGEGPFRLDLRPSAEHTAANNRFANAIELDGSRVYNYRTHNYGLSAEPGEPVHGGVDPAESLWWRFTVPPGGGGRYSVGTGQSESRILTAVYRTTNPAAPAFDNLVPVADNFDSAVMAFPDVAWDAEEGKTYYIALERATGVRGRLIFNFHRVPDNYVFAGAEVIRGISAARDGYNWGSVREPGEPGLGAPAAERGSRSLWWRWTAPVSGRFQVDTIGSETPAPEDNRPHPERTMLGMATRLGIFTGATVGGLSQVAVGNNRTVTSYGNSWMSEHRNSRVEFDANAGTTYYFLVNGENLDPNGTVNEAQTNTGRIRLNLAPLPPPPNAFFAGATVITGTEYRNVQPTFGARKEPGEPNHGGVSGGRSLWWRWTAPESGPFVVSTAGNLYDDFHARRTGIGVYTGSTVGGLTTVASDQNGAGFNTGANTWSSVTFNAVAGTTYHFGVDAVHPGNLSFILTRPPANDGFTDAIEMRGSRWTATGHNLGASREPGEPRVDGGYFEEPDNNFRSVWWKWTAPVTGEVAVDTMGSESVNVIGVFTGNAVNALSPVTEVPKNSGNPFNGDASVRARSGNNNGGPTTFVAQAGTTYHITVQGAGFIVPSSGPIRLTLTGPPAVPFAPEDVAAARVDDRRVDLLWTDAAVDEEAYIVERRVDGGGWTVIHEAPPGTTRYSDFDAPAGPDYAYRVRARNSVGESDAITAEWQTLLDNWRQRHFGTTANSGAAADTAVPFGDGVANLLKYAFNMHGGGFDDSFLAPGAGTSGLPTVHPAATAEADALVIEYLRRRPNTNPGIEYIVEFSADPAFAHTASGVVERVFVLDGSWERVRVRDTEAPDRRFGRVRVRRAD